MRLIVFYSKKLWLIKKYTVILTDLAMLSNKIKEFGGKPMSKNLQLDDYVRKSLKETKIDLIELQKVLDESVIVSTTDKDGNITYANNAFCKISKYTINELLGQNHRILKSGHHPPEFYEDLWKTISNGRIWKNEIKNVAKDGSYYWVNTIISPILDKRGKPKQYISIRIDITKQKEAEKKLKLQSRFKRRLDALKEIDKQKEEFASMVTHELKTPLSPIMLYCELLRDKSQGELNADQLESVNEIYINAERLEILIGDILDAQKLAMNMMTFSEQKIDIAKLLDKVMKDVSVMRDDKRIQFVNSNSSKSIILADEDRIIQTMENLIRNSVDFVPEEHGRIEIGARDEDSKVIFYVKDNGIGIPKDKQKNLFKKFYQIDTSHTRKHGGSGLGLAICWGIVRRLGGSMWFESEEGKGVDFYFSIPKRT